MSYVTVDQLATWLSMDDAVAHTNEAELGRAVNSASAICDKMANRNFRVTREMPETWRHFDPDVTDLLQPFTRPRYGPWPARVE